MNNTTTPTAPSIPCPKCYGAKVFQPFAHIADGVCFRCGGAGVVDALNKGELPAPARVQIPDGTYSVLLLKGPGAGFCCADQGSYDDAREICDGLRKEHGRFVEGGPAAYIVVKVVAGKWQSRSGCVFGDAVRFERK